MLCYSAIVHWIGCINAIKLHRRWEGLVCPSDRVFTYKNLIYLLNLQFSFSEKIKNLYFNLNTKLPILIDLFLTQFVYVMDCV